MSHIHYPYIIALYLTGFSLCHFHLLYLVPFSPACSGYDAAYLLLTNPALSCSSSGVGRDLKMARTCRGKLLRLWTMSSFLLTLHDLHVSVYQVQAPPCPPHSYGHSVWLPLFGQHTGLHKIIFHQAKLLFLAL